MIVFSTRTDKKRFVTLRSPPEADDEGSGEGSPHPRFFALPLKDSELVNKCGR